MNELIEKLVGEFENRFGGFIATANKRKKQDNDNQWFRTALQSAYGAGGESVHKKWGEAFAKNWVTAREEGARQERERVLEAIEALSDMYGQYCADGHAFMSAGEGAEVVLQKHGYGFDEAGRITKYPVLSPSTEAKGKKCNCNRPWDKKVNYFHRDDCPLGTNGVNEK